MRTHWIAVIGVTALGCSRPTPPSPPSETPVPVPAVRIGTNQQSETYQAAGVVRAETRAELSTRIAGRIESVRVRAGDRVAAGQVVATLDPASVEAGVGQVEAGLALAKSQLARMERLYADSAVPLAQLEVIRAQHAQLVAQASGAEAERRYAILTAPFAGTVTARTAEPGDLATPGRPLITIEGAGRREIVIGVPDDLIRGLKRGQSIAVRVGAQERSVAATIVGIVPSADPSTRTVEIRLTTSTPLVSNLPAVAEIPAPGKAALLVPRSAVVNRGQLQGVFLFASDSTVRLRWIRLGRVAGEEVEVISGLRDGDLVVQSATTVRDGARAIPLLAEDGS